jgi:hypothetical protein
MYNRCLERGSDEYTFSDYTKRIMDGSSESLFLNEGTSGGSVKMEMDDTHSAVTNSDVMRFEPGHCGSVSLPDLEAAHAGIHNCLGAESTEKIDKDDLNGDGNSSNCFGRNRGSSCDSAPVADPGQVELIAKPPELSTDMTIRIRRIKSEVSELSTVHSTHAEFNGVAKPELLFANSARVRRGRPKRGIEEDHPPVPIPPDTVYLNSISSSPHVEDCIQNKDRNRIEDETLDFVFSPRTASTDLAADGETFENFVSAEVSFPIERETLIETAQDYTISLPLNIPTTSGATILKILKKRKMRNLNVLTESSVPLSEPNPLDAAYRQPNGEQNSDPL